MRKRGIHTETCLGAESHARYIHLCMYLSIYRSMYLYLYIYICMCMYAYTYVYT